MNYAEILAATFVIAGVEWLASALLLWRPRMLELMEERDVWRDRAIAAEGDAETSVRDFRLLTDWGSATDGIIAAGETDDG